MTPTRVICPSPHLLYCGISTIQYSNAQLECGRHHGSHLTCTHSQNKVTTSGAVENRLRTHSQITRGQGSRLRSLSCLSDVRFYVDYNDHIVLNPPLQICSTFRLLLTCIFFYKEIFELNNQINKHLPSSKAPPKIHIVMATCLFPAVFYCFK